MKVNCKRGCAANPVLRLFLCLCPVAAAATDGMTGLAMGVLMLFVLLCSGLILTILKKLLPEGARVPATILIACLAASMAQILLNTWLPVLALDLGIFVSLSAIGAMLCLLIDDCACPACIGTKSGIASLIALTIVGSLREVIGFGSIFGAKLWNSGANVLIARFPASAYILLGVLLGIYAAIRNRGEGDAK